ncbi:hypothetical protein D3C87_1709940 [compost metagenome]
MKTMLTKKPRAKRAINQMTSSDVEASVARQMEQPMRLAMISLSAEASRVSRPRISVATPRPAAKPMALRPIMPAETPRLSSESEISG